MKAKLLENVNLCECGGELSLKNSFRFGAFIGCSKYPDCKFTRPLCHALKQLNKTSISRTKRNWKNMIDGYEI